MRSVVIGRFTENRMAKKPVKAEDNQHVQKWQGYIRFYLYGKTNVGGAVC